MKIILKDKTIAFKKKNTYILRLTPKKALELSQNAGLNITAKLIS